MNQEQVISDNKYLNLWKDLLRMEYSKGRYDTLNEVIEWLDEHLLDYWGQQNSDPSEFIVEFKKAMKTYEDELLEEYHKRQTNGFNTGYTNAVDKAVEWLKNNADKYTDTDYGVPFLYIGIMINDFKKAMEL